MVRVASMPQRRSPMISLRSHWASLAALFSVAALFGIYLLLSSKEERAHGSMMRASRLSAATMLKSGKPYLIYGTAWKKSDTARLVSEAVRAGFRFVDTACQPKHYDEAGVGEGWTSAADELRLGRSDLHLQTKFTSVGGQDPNNVPYDRDAPLEEQVRQSMRKSLENLRTTYLDSLVLHSPMPAHEDTMRVWRVFESFVDGGTVRGLGISNCYDPKKFARTYDEARIKPSVLQNRFYEKSGFDTELRKFCRSRGVQYQSFWTLTANRKALSTVDIETMAEEKGLTPQTLMYAFMMTLGHTPLSGTKNQVHMEEDVALMKRFQAGERVFTDEAELKKMAQVLGMSEL